MSEQATNVLDLGLARLVHIEERISGAEGDGLRARWEFGHELLSQRGEDGRLPRGYIAAVAERTEASRPEISNRLRFAERYPTEEQFVYAVNAYRSWHRVLSVGLATTEDEDSGETPEAPPGTFATLVADPPWQYANKATRGAAEDHYRTLSVPELCELDVPHEKAAPAAHLYLWTTAGFLREAFEVMDAWGFTYKTYLAWVKPQMGMGNYFRVSSELVLFGTKGGLATQPAARSLMNWFAARRGKHSAKPDAFPELVQKASPGPYLELFARCRSDRQLICYCTRCRFGWGVWGLET